MRCRPHDAGESRQRGKLSMFSQSQNCGWLPLAQTLARAPTLTLSRFLNFPWRNRHRGNHNRTESPNMTLCLDGVEQKPKIFLRPAFYQPTFPTSAPTLSLLKRPARDSSAWGISGQNLQFWAPFQLIHILASHYPGASPGNDLPEKAQGVEQWNKQNRN